VVTPKKVEKERYDHMGLKTQFRMKQKQRIKRKNKRDKIAAKGLDLKDYFYGKYYLKSGKSK
jgi:hypothetical protein